MLKNKTVHNTQAGRSERNLVQTTSIVAIIKIIVKYEMFTLQRPPAITNVIGGEHRLKLCVVRHALCSTKFKNVLFKLNLYNIMY